MGDRDRVADLPNHIDTAIDHPSSRNEASDARSRTNSARSTQAPGPDEQRERQLLIDGYLHRQVDAQDLLRVGIRTPAFPYRRERRSPERETSIARIAGLSWSPRVQGQPGGAYLGERGHRGALGWLSVPGTRNARRSARRADGRRMRDLARGGGLSPTASRSQTRREDRQAEGLGIADHALVVGDQCAELTRDACGRGEMDRVERAQRRPTDLRSSRDYRLDR